ncbi:glycerate kinase [Lentisphaera profundi]|uniref:Glycerate kinase n=1 Tax=Lentisphaera profundi TaxID=1658616 RepID=A0ABY7VXV9_9BACT|nr:glycerate kinase [Lentisphaera profundi]WDE99063.1 glycerate kinase [Lentisphaera profundi]
MGEAQVAMVGQVQQAALGWKFFDKAGKEFIPSAGTLLEIESLVAPKDMELWPRISALCDVQNPMTGKSGAAYVFGPQKGASSEQVVLIDRGLRHLAHLFRTHLKKDVEAVAGSGVAGAFGGGAMAMMGAQLVPGIETILDWCGADEVLSGANYLVTGEGCLDLTSFNGKLVGGICERYQNNSNLSICLIAGVAKLDSAFTEAKGLAYVGECRKPGQTETDAFAKAEENFLESLDDFYKFIKI